MIASKGDGGGEGVSRGYCVIELANLQDAQTF